MNQRFEQIYATNEWGHGSGEGSLPQHTQGYAAFLQQFLKDNRIGSVVEMGCGDWQFSRFLDWSGAQYRGFDVVPAVVARNQQSYARPGVSFQLYSGNPSELPAADLLIVKDVLQHLSDRKVMALLAELPRFKRALITNCVNPSGRASGHRDIEDGDYRWLDLLQPPYNLQARKVYEFTNAMNPILRLLWRPRWRKHVLLAEQP